MQIYRNNTVYNNNNNSLYYCEMNNCYWTLTCLWTESIGLILVIVFCGGTPAVPIIPA